MNNYFKYTTGLHKIRKMKKRIKIIPGGTSAGKTFAILSILINKAIIEPDLEISVVSESIPHLRRGALRDFLKIMKTTGRYNPNNYNKTYLTYTFSNGSYIEFFSADDEAKLRGARRNILYINEANNLKQESYIQLAMRTDRDIYLDYNPVAQFWINDVEKEEEAEKLILTYKDNEALSKNVIDFLESKIPLSLTSDYWRNWVNVYLYGQQGSLEGIVFSNWSTIDSIPEGAGLIGSGMDFGFTNDPTTLISVYKYNNNIIVDEVIYRKGLSNSDISNLMKSANVTGEIFGDSAEPKTIDELRRYGHNIKGANKGADSINFGISILQEYDMLITKRSYNLLDELTKYIWKKDRDGNTSNSPIDAFNHAIDALRYLAMMKLSKKQPGKIKIMRR